jgi:hypothetical protein
MEHGDLFYGPDVIAHRAAGHMGTGGVGDRARSPDGPYAFPPSRRRRNSPVAFSRSWPGTQAEFSQERHARPPAHGFWPFPSARA